MFESSEAAGLGYLGSLGGGGSICVLESRSGSPVGGTGGLRGAFGGFRSAVVKVAGLCRFGRLGGGGAISA